MARSVKLKADVGAATSHRVKMKNESSAVVKAKSVGTIRSGKKCRSGKHKVDSSGHRSDTAAYANGMAQIRIEDMKRSIAEQQEKIQEQDARINIQEGRLSVLTSELYDFRAELEASNQQKVYSFQSHVRELGEQRAMYMHRVKELEYSTAQLSHVDLITKAKAMGIKVRNGRAWRRKEAIIEDLMSQGAQSQTSNDEQIAVAQALPGDDRQAMIARSLST